MASNIITNILVVIAGSVFIFLGIRTYITGIYVGKGYQQKVGKVARVILGSMNILVGLALIVIFIRL